MNKFFITLVVGSLVALALLGHARHEAACATASVTKCLTTQSCGCDLINCSCCKQCSMCLDHSYSDCCSCLGKCPKPNVTIDLLSKQSNIEDLPESVMLLFDSLVAELDIQQRWESLTFPVRFDAEVFRPNSKSKVELLQNNYTFNVTPTKDLITLNCSVAYMNDCMTRIKCKKLCMSMGAKSYRWFHDGCCECVGDRCMNYGINESRCNNCPKEVEAMTTTSKADFSDEKDDKKKDSDREMIQIRKTNV